MNENDKRIVPETLYKYRSLKGDALSNSLAILSQNEAYFARPEELNDPYECHARLDTSTLRALFNNQKHKDHLELEEAVRKNMRRSLRVFCLSETFSNPLMWSHYADNHRGICIGFNTTQMKNLEPVEYVSVTPIIEGNSEESIHKSMALTKSEHWQYEREWRAVNSDEGQVVPLPYDCVVEVTLGCEVSIEYSQQVVSSLMLRSIKHKPTKLYRALRNREGYSIDRRELGVADGRPAVDSMGTMDVEDMIDRALELLA